MLQRIRIQGFQSHVDTDVTFDEGMNVVVGDNGSGKSALRRAFEWVRTNRPSGDSFINWNTGMCEVTVWFDGHEITRRRGGNVNEYVVDGETLTGFGVQVPEPVERAFGMDDTNVELQHSALFMLSESPPEMARRLNRVTNLEDIDEAFSIVRRRKLETQRELKAEAETMGRLDKELEAFAFLDDVRPVLAEAKEANDIMLSVREKHQDVQATVQGYRALPPELPTMAVDMSVVDELRGVSVDYQDVDTLLRTLVGLTVLPEPGVCAMNLEVARDELVTAVANHKAICTLVDDMQKLVVVDPPMPSSSISLDAVKEAIDMYLGAQTAIDTYHGLSRDLEDGEQKLVALIEEMKQNTPALCPLCGNPIGACDDSDTL